MPINGLHREPSKFINGAVMEPNGTIRPRTTENLEVSVPPLVELLKKPGKSKKGGAREGAGRKPNADFTARELFKKAFDEIWTEEDWKQVIRDAKSGTDKGLRTYIIDQRIGKAAQSMDVTTNGKDMQGFVVLPPKNE